MADPEPADDETVGFQRPPKKHRFPKGKSPNPGGRPKKRALDSDDRLIALVEAQVPHSQHTVLDLILKSAIRAAAQGDIKALRFIYENYLLAKRRRRSTTTDDDGDRAIFERLLGPDHPLLKDIVDETSKSVADEAPAPDETKSHG